jgi:hypothetical protein
MTRTIRATKVATRWCLRPACIECLFEQVRLRNANSRSSQEPCAFGWSIAAFSVDDARRLANAVSMADAGVRSTDATGDDDSRSCVSEHAAVASVKMPIAVQVMIVCKLCERETKRTIRPLPATIFSITRRHLLAVEDFGAKLIEVFKGGP